MWDPISRIKIEATSKETAAPVAPQASFIFSNPQKSKQTLFSPLPKMKAAKRENKKRSETQHPTYIRTWGEGKGVMDHHPDSTCLPSFLPSSFATFLLPFLIRLSLSLSLSLSLKLPLQITAFLCLSFLYFAPRIFYFWRVL